MALWSGRGHKLDVASRRAERLLSSGRFEHGRPARSLFPERIFRPALATFDAAMDTGEPVILRQRLWQPFRRYGMPKDIKLVARPLFVDDGASHPIGVLAEGHIACDDPRCDALDRCCQQPMDRRRNVAPESLTYGAMSFYESHIHGMTPEAAVGLVDIRMAARDAFVEAAGPLVDELRRLRRVAPAGLGSRPQSQQRRPS